MFIVFQYPIVDYRNLIEKNYKLSKPSWPDPKIGEMQKYTGYITRGRNGDAFYRSDKEKYCTAEKAIKFVALQKKILNINDGNYLTFEGLDGYRFFQSDGNFLAKYEIGLQSNYDDFIPQINEKKNIFENFLVELCKVKLKIKNPLKEDVISDIGNCGEYLSNLYLYSSSEIKKNKINEIEKWWVSGGNSLCIVEYMDCESKIKLPKSAVKIHEYENEKFTLYKYTIELSGIKNIKTWLIKITDENYDENICRQLRLNLLRINEEKEVYRKMVSFLEEKGKMIKDIEKKEKSIGIYLEDLTCKLFKMERYGITQKDLFDYAIKSYEKPKPELHKSYKRTLEKLNNKYVIKNHEKLIKKGLAVPDENLKIIKTILSSFIVIFILLIIASIIVPDNKFNTFIFALILLTLVYAIIILFIFKRIPLKEFIELIKLFIQKVFSFFKLI